MLKDRRSRSSEKYIKAIQTDILGKLQGSLVLLINNINEIYNIDNWPKDFEKPQLLTESCKHVIECTKKLEDLVSIPVQSRSNELSRLFEAKEDICKLERSLQIYGLYLQRIDYIGSYKYGMQNVSEYPEIIDFSGNNKFSLTDLCLQYVETFEEDSQSDAIRDILLCFPVKMTKEKFLDYVRESLTLLLPAENQLVCNNVVEINKNNFNSVKLSSEQIYFTELIEILNSLYEKSCRDDVNIELNQEISDVFEMIDNIRNQMLTVYESINFLIILLSYVTDADALFNNDLIVKDLYYTICSGEYLQDEELRERVQELLDNQSEYVIDFIHQNLIKSSDINLYLSNIGDSDESKALFNSFIVIRHAFYENLWDSAFLLRNIDIGQEYKDTSIPVEPHVINDEIEGLIAILRDTLTSEAPKTQRLLKSYFLSTLPCPYSINSLETFLEHNLDDSLSNAAKNFILFQLYELFSEAGFVDQQEASKHVHSHDCDCEHTHSHDCNCEHTHSHDCDCEHDH